MSENGTLPQRTPPLPENFMEVMLRCLDHDADATADFMDGLSKQIHRLSVDPSVDSSYEFVSFARRWLLSAYVDRAPARRAVIEESERLIEAGDLGESTKTSDLRSLIRG